MINCLWWLFSTRSSVCTWKLFAPSFQAPTYFPQLCVPLLLKRRLCKCKFREKKNVPRRKIYSTWKVLFKRMEFFTENLLRAFISHFHDWTRICDAWERAWRGRRRDCKTMHFNWISSKAKFFSAKGFSSVLYNFTDPKAGRDIIIMHHFLFMPQNQLPNQELLQIVAR